MSAPAPPAAPPARDPEDANPAAANLPAMPRPEAKPYPAPGQLGWLPESSGHWPPRELQTAIDRMAGWEAWWAGDVDQLGAYYGARNGIPSNRPSAPTGGFRGTLARMWHGRPPAPGETPTKLHVPLAKDIVRSSADLLFAEPVTVEVDDQATREAFEELCGDQHQAALLEAAETGAALGGVYLLPAHNALISDHAWTESIPPDQVWPQWIGGQLASATLWRIVHEEPDRSIVLRHLERHEPGWTVHALYQGDAVNLGRAIPLTEHKSTAHLAGYVGHVGEIASGFPRLAASYVPNMRPFPLWRRDGVLAPFGAPDLHGIEGVLDALDETYSDWMRDVRLAKGRLLMPDSFLNAGRRGDAPVADLDREVYVGLPGALDPGDKGVSYSITLAQFAIRVDEHERTAHELRDVAVTGAGYSAASFGSDQEGTAVTATEIKARRAKTYTTRSRKITYWRPGLRNHLAALAVTDAVVFGRPMPKLDGLTVQFSDGVSDDLLTLANTAEVMSRAKAASVRTLVELLHPDWDETRVQEEVDAIGEENAPPLVDLLPGDGPPGGFGKPGEDGPPKPPGAKPGEKSTDPEKSTPGDGERKPSGFPPTK